MSASSARNQRKQKHKQFLFVKEKQHAMLDEYELKALVNEYATQVKEVILFENERCGKIVFETFSAAKIAVQKLQGHRKFSVRYWRESDAPKSEVQATRFPSSTVETVPSESCLVEARNMPPKTTLVEPKECLLSSRQVETKHNPPTSKLVEVKIVEEPLPCSKELMMYILDKFRKKKFTALWRQILPVKVNPRNGVVYVKGVAEDVKTAIDRILGHPLLEELNMKLVYTKVDPRKIKKKVSMTSPQTFVIYNAHNRGVVLLCSRNLSELKETKKLIDGLKPITRHYQIPFKAEFQKKKLDSLLANFKDSCVNVQMINHTTQLICQVYGLCEEDINSAWHQVQQCFKQVTKIVHVQASQWSIGHNAYTLEAKMHSCKVWVPFTDFNSLDPSECVPITVSGYNQENVESTVAYITRNTSIKERIEFKDESVGCLMINSAVHLQKQVAAAACKGAKLSVINEPPCYGFLVDGTPKAVKEVIQNISQYYEYLMKNREEVKFRQIILKSVYGPVCSVEKIAEWKENLMNKFTVSSSFSLVSDEWLDDVTSQAFLSLSPNHVVTVKIVVGRLGAQKTDAIVIPTDRMMEGIAYPVQLPQLCTESFQDRSCKFLYSPLNLSQLGNAGILDSGKLPCSYIIHILYPTKNFNFTGSGESDFIKSCLSVASRKRMGSICFPEVSTHMVQPLMTGLQSLNPTDTIHTVSIVVGSKQQASLYAKMLKNTVTSNVASKNPVPLSSASASVEFVWSWKNDAGVFVPYTKAATDLLNQAYQRNPDAFCNLTIVHLHYSIDFKTMMQSSISSFNKREVTKSPKNKLQQSVVWKYQNDSGIFSTYLPADSAQIECMYQQRDASRTITINLQRYNFDFNAMRQVNTYSNFSRIITRIVSFPTPPKIIQPVFLNNGEVIINLKGPSRNIQNARVYIQDQLKKQLSFKDIPLPSSLPSVLQRNLEALSKKHSLLNCEVMDLGTTMTKKVLRVQGLESLVQNALTEFQGVILSFTLTCPGPLMKESSLYPQTWEPMSDKEWYKIVNLPATSNEFSSVHTRFMKTMSGHKVLQIKRVQNKWIWDHYTHTKLRMYEKNDGRVNELNLFHGSRKVASEIICGSEEGFDMRHSREGMWGQANYFAENAGYSDSYAYYDSVQCFNEMMLATVLTGDSFSCDKDPTLRMPPIKKNPDKNFQVKYDSVTGKTQGCKIYMTYCNENAYPAYIIKYTVAGSGGSWGTSNTTYARWMQPNPAGIVPPPPTPLPLPKLNQRPRVVPPQPASQLNPAHIVPPPKLNPPHVPSQAPHPKQTISSKPKNCTIS